METTSHQEIKMKNFLKVMLLVFLSVSAWAETPESFRHAKYMLKDKVYFDQNLGSNAAKTIYCGCEWDWRGRTGGEIDLNSCGVNTEKYKTRLGRIEVEHLVSAHLFGHQRQCWQNGGRKNCQENDPVYNRMAGDLSNLWYAVGSVNAMRSNYRQGELASSDASFGQCQAKIDYRARTFTPPDRAKGIVARTYFYMADRYDLRLSKREQQTYMAWNKQFPPSDWEIERNRRITNATGVSNDFITGKKVWSLNHKNSREGLFSDYKPKKEVTVHKSKHSASSGAIKGHKKSKIYHLPVGCGSYSKISPRNVVEFNSEKEAISAGFRKAGNCR